MRYIAIATNTAALPNPIIALCIALGWSIGDFEESSRVVVDAVPLLEIGFAGVLDGAVLVEFAVLFSSFILSGMRSSESGIASWWR